MYQDDMYSTVHQIHITTTNLRPSVADPDLFYMDPDPPFHIDTDPDPAFQFDTDPGLTDTNPDPYRSNEEMYLKLYFLYIFTDFPCQYVQQDLHRKYSLLNFPFQLILLCH